MMKSLCSEQRETICRLSDQMGTTVAVVWLDFREDLRVITKVCECNEEWSERILSST